MKKQQILAGTLFSALLFLAGCQPINSPKESSGWSDSEKETAKKEIALRIEEIVDGAEKLDLTAALQPYSDTPEFILVTPDGRVTGFEDMKNEQSEFFSQAASIRFSTIKEDFKFLSDNLVLCTWTGSNEIEMKTGEKMKIEPYVGSMLFHKKDSEWKIIYAHESTAPPVMTETGK